MDQPAQINAEPTPQPVATNPQPPIPSQKTSKLPLIFLVVLVIGMIGVAAFWLGKSLNGPKIVVQPTPTVFPTISEPTPTPDLTADWKVLKVILAGFEIKYPSTWEAREEKGPKSNDVYFGNPAIKDVMGKTLGTVTLSYSNDLSIKVLELEDVPKDVNLTAIGAYDAERFIWEPILVGGVMAKRVKHSGCQSASCDNVLLRNGDWTFGLSMNQSDEKDQKIFDQILSTFKFLP